MLYFIDGYFTAKNVDGISTVDIKIPIFIESDRELLCLDEEYRDTCFQLGYALTEDEQEKVWVGMEKIKLYIHHLIVMDGWRSMRDTTDIHMEQHFSVAPYFNLICESTLWVDGVKGYKKGVIDNALLEEVAKNPNLVIRL